MGKDYLLLNGCLTAHQVSIGAFGTRGLFDDGSTIQNAVSKQPLAAPLMGPLSAEVILRFSNLPLKVGTLSHICGRRSSLLLNGCKYAHQMSIGAFGARQLLNDGSTVKKISGDFLQSIHHLLEPEAPLFKIRLDFGGTLVACEHGIAHAFNTVLM